MPKLDDYEEMACGHCSWKGFLHETQQDSVGEDGMESVLCCPKCGCVLRSLDHGE